MITSPYNFVPLSENVVSPFWAKHVNHDIPFEGGLSGVLNLQIEAKSPIYVRNGVFSNVGEHDIERKKFNHFQNKLFIPSSSIKGMLRSVMEIMSFGRMENKVNDDRYSVRDFTNTKGDDALYPILKITPNIHCGWLYKKDGTYFLRDCGKPARISHRTIQDHFGNGMADFYKVKDNVKPNSKSANSKYNKFPFEKKGHFKTSTDSVGRTLCSFDEDGKKGTIVLTGQPGERKEPANDKATGKHLEFVFWDSNGTPIPVKEEVIKTFFFAYYDHDKPQQQDDWKLLRKPQLDSGEEIPVFFRKEGKEIVDMGLAFLYKITYKNSIIESIKKTQKKADDYDLAETIFGYVDGNGKEALKGRVHIGHAFTEGAVPFPKEKEAVLSGPKASYYPNYVEQGNTSTVQKYTTFMNTGSKIRGWKRYPVRYNGTIDNKGTSNVSTYFIPLNQGAKFTFDIHYHNLRKEELGALISAITFHNTEGVYHSLGMAKPLGYGKITLSIQNLDEQKKLEYLKAYEAFMEFGLQSSAPSWSKTEQIKELVAMAKGSPNADVDAKLAYMKLTTSYNEFAEAKKAKKVLQRFSNISQNTEGVTSLITSTDISAAKAKFETEKLALARIQNKEELKQQTKAVFETALQKRFEEKKIELLAYLAAKQQKQKETEDALREEERLKKRENLGNEAAQADLIFKAFEFDNVKEVVNKHCQKYKIKVAATELTDHQKSQLKAALTTSYQSIKNPKKDKWLKKDNKFTEFPWTAIREWLGEDEAKALHCELIKTH